MSIKKTLQTIAVVAATAVGIAEANGQQAIKTRTSDTVMKHLALANGTNPSQLTGPNSINNGQSGDKSTALVGTPEGTFMTATQANITSTTISNETIGATTLSFNNALQTIRQTSGEIQLTFTQKDARVDIDNNGIVDGHFTTWILPTLQTNNATIPNNTRVRLTTPTLTRLSDGSTIVGTRADRLRRDVAQNKRVDEVVNPLGAPEANNRVDRAEYLGIDTATMGTATIYPNPASDIITISTPQNIGAKKVEIYSISGQRVQSQVLSAGTDIFSISSLPAGIFVLTTEDEDGNKTINKIIKK